MDVNGYIQRQFSDTLRYSDAANEDLTQAQLDWVPAGTANSIGIILVHVATSEDRLVAVLCQGQRSIWETGGWQQKFGIAPPGAGQGFEEARGKPISLETVRSYMGAVRAQTRAFLAGLTDEELERRIPWKGEEMPVAQVVARLLAHTALHAGEIAILKGLQGAKGLPF